MKTIIAGSRGITDLRLVERVIEESGFKITEVVCGGARGVDSLGRKWAGNGGIIPVKIFQAFWNVEGIFRRDAGYKRNIEMAEYADALIAIWDGHSLGTRHMIEIAKKRGLVTFVHVIEEV